MMHTALLPHLHNAWNEGRNALMEVLNETITGLEELLRLEDYHRHGHEDQKLREAMGPFGESSFNLESLSSMLGDAVRTRFMTKERFEHVQELLAALRESQERWKANPPSCGVISLRRKANEIHERAENHFNEMADLFRSIRVAQLEIKAKYQPQRHDSMFLDFNWRHLGPAEIRLCPPFLVIAELRADDRATLRKVMALLTSRKPIKVIALRSALRKTYPSTTDTQVPATMDVEMLPLALRGVYVLQTSFVLPDFRERLAAALRSPRPGVISLYWRKGAPDEPAFQVRAERALQSRTFPVFEYDPDRADEFVSCFDLTGNPDINVDWVQQKVVYLDDHGTTLEMDRHFTFANFASEEAEFEDGFSDPPPNVPAESLVPLSSFLTFSRHQRTGTLPFITVTDGNQKLVQKVPSQEIITQTSDRLHLWRTLKEFAGIDNPHVHAARTALHSELGGECEESMERLREEMEVAARQREKAAMAHAVRQITAYLTGVEASEISLESLLQQEPGDASPPPDEA